MSFAPFSRSVFASASTIDACGLNSSGSTFFANVVEGVSTVEMPMMPTSMSPTRLMMRRLDVRPCDALAGGLVVDVGGENRELRFAHPLLHHRERVFSAAATEVELVIAEDAGVVFQDVHGGDSRLSAKVVRGKATAVHVAGVEQQHRVLGRGAGGGDVAAEQGNPPSRTTLSPVPWARGSRVPWMSLVASSVMHGSACFGGLSGAPSPSGLSVGFSQAASAVRTRQAQGTKRRS